MIDIVNKDYKITARIMIQDGQHSHIRRFKSEMEYDGQIDDKFEMRVLRAFEADIQAEASQTTLPSKEKEEVPAKKSGKKPEGT